MALATAAKRSKLARRISTRYIRRETWRSSHRFRVNRSLLRFFGSSRHHLNEHSADRQHKRAAGPGYDLRKRKKIHAVGTAENGDIA